MRWIFCISGSIINNEYNYKLIENWWDEICYE